MDTIQKNINLTALTDFITNHEQHAIYKIALALAKDSGEITMALCSRIAECLKQTNFSSLNNLYLPEFEDIVDALPPKFLNIVMSSYTTFLASISPAHLLSKALTTAEHDVCKAINFIGVRNSQSEILNAHLVFLRRLTNVVSQSEYFPVQIQRDLVLLTSLQKEIIAKAASHYIEFPLSESVVGNIHKLFIDSIWEEALTTETDILSFSGGIAAWQAKKTINVSQLNDANINLISFILQNIQTHPSSSFLAGYIYASVLKTDFPGNSVFLAQLKQLPKVEPVLLKAGLAKSLIYAKEQKHPQAVTVITELVDAFESSFFV